MIIHNSLLPIVMCLSILTSAISKSTQEVAGPFADNQHYPADYNQNIALLYAICHIPTICDRAYEVNKAILCGADLEAIIPGDESGTTALMHSALHARFNTTSLLLSHGANANAKSTDGTTPLMHAAATRHINTPEIIHMLLQYCADINTENNAKYTVLHYAALYGSAETIRLLIKNKANVNATNTGGITPLKMATLCGRSTIAELLIFAGAQPILGNQESAKLVLEPEQKDENPDIMPQDNTFSLYSSPLPATSDEFTQKITQRLLKHRLHRHQYRRNYEINVLEKIVTSLIN